MADYQHSSIARWHRYLFVGFNTGVLVAIASALQPTFAQTQHCIAGNTRTPPEQSEPVLAETSLAIARTRYERHQTLFEQGAISREQLDEAQAEYLATLARSNAEVQALTPGTSPTPSGELALAEARISLAQTTYERYQALFEQGAISRQQLDAAQADYEAALVQRNTLLSQSPNPNAVQPAQLTPIRPCP